MKSRANALYFTSFPKLYKGCVSENKLPRDPISFSLQTIYKRLFTPLFLLKD